MKGLFDSNPAIFHLGTYITITETKQKHTDVIPPLLFQFQVLVCSVTALFILRIIILTLSNTSFLDRNWSGLNGR